MRDLTKSIFSLSWAMSLLGVQQTLNLMKPSKATEVFDKVTEATKREMDDPLKATFDAGDNLQKGLVDLTLGMFTGQSLNPSKWMRMTSDLLNQSAEVVGKGLRAATSGAQQAASGWGSRSAAGQNPGPDSKAAAGPGPAPSSSQGWGPMPSSGASRK